MNKKDDVPLSRDIFVISCENRNVNINHSLVIIIIQSYNIGRKNKIKSYYTYNEKNN